jgi:hypothetical protein
VRSRRRRSRVVRLEQAILTKCRSPLLAAVASVRRFHHLDNSCRHAVTISAWHSAYRCRAEPGPHAGSEGGQRLQHCHRSPPRRPTLDRSKARAHGFYPNGSSGDRAGRGYEYIQDSESRQVVVQDEVCLGRGFMAIVTITSTTKPGLDTVGELAHQLRVDSIRASTSAGSGHPTSSMSAADLLATLIARHLRCDWDNPKSPSNDHHRIPRRCG